MGVVLESDPSPETTRGNEYLPNVRWGHTMGTGQIRWGQVKYRKEAMGMGQVE
jgi:hypothetical protein